MNKIICGDNLDTLDKIDNGTIQFCYIDPPYNVLKKQNKYKDSFSSHKEWCDMMRPRLIKAYDKLLPSGVIAVSIDDVEHAHLRILMDELFGEKNFLANLIWIKAASQQTTKTFIKKHENIICFCKDKKQLKMNRKLSEVKDDKRYKFRDEKETFWIMPDGSVSFVNPNKQQIEVVETNNFMEKNSIIAKSADDQSDRKNHKYPIEVQDNQHYHDPLTLSATSQSECRIIGKNDPIEITDNSFQQSGLAHNSVQNGIAMGGKDVRNPIEIDDNTHKTEALQKNGNRIGSDSQKGAIEIKNKSPIEQPVGKKIKLETLYNYLDDTKHYIYIHQNKLNLKVYVGYTKQPHIRWRDTKRGAFDPNFEFYNQPLYNAIRRDGWDNFDHHVIEVFDNKEDALEAEIFWIEFFRSNRNVYGKEYGYNMHEGGNCPPSRIGSIPYNKGKNTPQVSVEKMKKSKINPSDEVRNNISKGGQKFDEKTKGEIRIAYKEKTIKQLAEQYGCANITIYRILHDLNRIKKKLLIPVNEMELQLPYLVFARTAWRWCQKKIKWAKENNIVGYKKNKKGDYIAYFKQYSYLTTAKDKQGNYSLVPIIRSSPFDTVLKDIAPDRRLSKLFSTKNLFHYAKPVPLMIRLLEIFTNKGDKVLDLFAGSGTMNIACFQQDRNCIGLQSNESNIFDDVLIPCMNDAIGQGNYTAVK